MSGIDPTASIRDYTAAAGATPAAPITAPAEIAQATSRPLAAMSTPPTRRGVGLLVAAVLGITLVSIVCLLVIVYLLVGLGPAAFAIGGVMALIPFTIVYLGVRWVDRWEPEPRAAVVFAFMWGAGVAVLMALIVGAEIDNVINSLGGPGPDYEFFGAAIQAPIVEEVGKGIGVLIIFFAARKHFDGPVDGLVYAAWVAGGFAFTENILYFGSQLIAQEGIVEIFIVRGIMSPFAHLMFTAFIGIALGLAARRGGTLRAIGYFIVGLVPAILLHAFWNGALFFVSDFFGYYFLVQVPLFLATIALVIFLRRQESKLTHDRLAEYASVGWMHEDEVNALATRAGRKQAIAWASRQGKANEMKRYIKDATRLAFARQRIITGRDRIGAHADEAELLTRMVASRATLVPSAQSRVSPSRDELKT